MAAGRFYIYRCGNTDACAVTATKDEPRLARSLCQTRWQFWMQVTRHQFEDGRSGFTFDARSLRSTPKATFSSRVRPSCLVSLLPAPLAKGHPRSDDPLDAYEPCVRGYTNATARHGALRSCY